MNGYTYALNISPINNVIVKKNVTCSHLDISNKPTAAFCSAKDGGGKSGLHRAECQVTPGRREPTESATENTQGQTRADRGRHGIALAGVASAAVDGGAG